MSGELASAACLLLVLIPATGAAAGHVPPLLPGAREILWVGAHPDDEVLAAPLLARLCVVERHDCSFLVLTRGEAGVCRLAGGCHPDLGTVRSREMEQAAELYGARLTQWSLPDGGGGDGWDSVSGGHLALVRRLSELIEANAPGLIITFDPRHVSTCHGDHRAAAALVMDSVSQLPAPPEVYWLETLVHLSAPQDPPIFWPAAGLESATAGLDANVPEPGFPDGLWRAVVDDAAQHPSQFDCQRLTALQGTLPEYRGAWFAPARVTQQDDSVWNCERSAPGTLFPR